MRAPGQILLLSTYELGHAPHHLASPLGFLERAGFAPKALDLAIEMLDEDAVRAAALVGIAAPMHTAVRLGVTIAERVRALAPSAKIVFYGLYAPLQREALVGAGLADELIGGEYEAALVALASRMEAAAPALSGASMIVLERLDFAPPSRTSLPVITRYAHLITEDGNRSAGYTESSRGCLHMCKHCPIPPVYEGRFFVVPAGIVLADIDVQVAAGARHITFGDPDFWNGPKHAMAVLQGMHARHPQLSFDATIKVEHILKHQKLLPELASLGCSFIVSAVESRSDHVLAVLDKGHTRADIDRALELTDAAGIALRPTLLPFTPMSTYDDYLELLDWIEARDLSGRVDPVQLAVRLLIPPGSLLLDVPSVRALIGAYDPVTLSHVWTHPDPRMRALESQVFTLIEAGTSAGTPAAELFTQLRALALSVGGGGLATDRAAPPPPRPAAPRLSEPWFCCAEPTTLQLGAVAAKV